MKKLPYYFSCTMLLPLAMQSVQAQKKPEKNILQPPPANIAVDGSLKEWGDSLRYYNEEKKINYSLANDKENLYLAVRINDRTEQARILNAGLTLSINTKGKKKDDFKITFPVADQNSFASARETMAAPPSDDPQPDHEAMTRARLTKLRGIKVEGFKDIEGDMITTSNTYGIQTSIDFDKDGYLIYEAAIPLKFFHVDDLTKSEWAFNIKINGIQRPAPKGDDNGGGGGGMRGGMGGGGMGGGMRGGGGGGMRGGGRRGGGSSGGSDNSMDRSLLSKSEDFWEKFYLNPNS